MDSLADLLLAFVCSLVMIIGFAACGDLDANIEESAPVMSAPTAKVSPTSPGTAIVPPVTDINKTAEVTCVEHAAEPCDAEICIEQIMGHVPSAVNYPDVKELATQRLRITAGSNGSTIKQFEVNVGSMWGAFNGLPTIRVLGCDGQMKSLVNTRRGVYLAGRLPGGDWPRMYSTVAELEHPFQLQPNESVMLETVYRLHEECNHTWYGPTGMPINSFATVVEAVITESGYATCLQTRPDWRDGSDPYQCLLFSPWITVTWYGDGVDMCNCRNRGTCAE